MDAQIIWTIVCGLAIAVGATGVIVPVLPGSLLIGVSLLVWALVLGSPLGWIVFSIGCTICCRGHGFQCGADRAGHEAACHSRQVGGYWAGAGRGGLLCDPGGGAAGGVRRGLVSVRICHGKRKLRPAVSSSVAALKATGWASWRSLALRHWPPEPGRPGC